MAQIIGEPGEEYGDQIVYRVLSKFPDDWFIYAQPVIAYKGEPRYPDYVLIHKDIGVAVIEVKDYKNIEILPDKILVQREGRKEEENPIKQVMKHGHALVNKLQEDDFLRNHAGKLDFPYRYGVIFVHIYDGQINQMREQWGDLVIGANDLKTPQSLLKAIIKLHIPPRKWSLPLTEKQIDAIRAAVRPENVVKSASGAAKGIYSPLQESLANEKISIEISKPDIQQRIQWLEEQMPQEQRPLTRSSTIRLVRGYPGTGKTDVLVLRAYYLRKNFPEWKILVTTFNKPLLEERLSLELKSLDNIDVKTFASICSEIRNHFLSQFLGDDPQVVINTGKPQKTIGLLNAIEQKTDLPIHPIIKKYGTEFLDREIQWIKEMRIKDRDTYINTSRRRIASQQGRRLSQKEKEEIYAVFEVYERKLQNLPAIDWHDFYNQAFEFLVEENYPPPTQYDAILVDEAQHFAPAWIKTLLRLLEPGGYFFACDDPSQGIYRDYSWKERGLSVVGHTRWLRIPYRHTRQIASFLKMISDENRELIELLQETNDYQPVEINHPDLRNGPLPELHIHKTQAEEKEFIADRIRQLVAGGILPSEIAIVHPEDHVQKHYEKNFPELKIASPINQTGMEYRVVVIPDISEYFKYSDISISFVETKIKNLQRFYVATSRARDILILSLVAHNRSDFFPKDIRFLVNQSDCITIQNHTNLRL